MANLPQGVLDGLKAQLTAPQPGPEIFVREDFKWLEGELKQTLVGLYKVAPDAQQTDALVAAMIQIALGISQRALRKYFLAIDPKFSHTHTQICGLFQQTSNLHTKTDGHEFRLKALEREATRHTEHIRQLQERLRKQETNDAE